MGVDARSICFQFCKRLYHKYILTFSGLDNIKMIVTGDINYRESDTNFCGYLAYDDQLPQPLPCVMVVHDWGGRGIAVCEKARQLASMGYVGFAIDMYGDGQLGHDNSQRRALVTPLVENRELLAARMLAALRAASALPQVDASKIAAIGYCFGGRCAIDMARTGAAIKGVVSFHGILSEPQGVHSGVIQARILVLHGYDDPMVRLDQVTNFATEMTLKKVDWQVHMYGLTAHSFTNPEANDDIMGLHYNRAADLRSWKTTMAFLDEVLS